MAVNVVGLAEIAERLIRENGRPCTFKAKSRLNANASKPWRESCPTGPFSVEDVPAVVFPSEWAAARREITRRPAAECLVAHNGFLAHDSTITIEIARQLDEVVDASGALWRIVAVDVLMPGVTPVIYTMKLEG